MMFARITLAIVLTAGLSSIARAEDIRCPASAAPAALSLEQAVGKAETLGYAVKEAKRKRSCWKIEGFDLTEHQRIKRETIANRRLQHRLQAA